MGDIVQDLLYYALYGAGMPTLGGAVSQIAVGIFFAISGFYKLFNATRHRSLVETLKSCGVPFVGFNQWFVPTVEFLGGMAVISGVFAPLAALGMLTILVVAIATDGRKKIPSYKPLGFVDTINCYLYLPECMMAVILIDTVLSGPHAFSLQPMLLAFTGNS